MGLPESRLGGSEGALRARRTLSYMHGSLPSGGAAASGAACPPQRPCVVGDHCAPSAALGEQPQYSLYGCDVDSVAIVSSR